MRAENPRVGGSIPSLATIKSWSVADESGIRLDQSDDVIRHGVTRFEKAPFARFILRGGQCTQKRRRFRITALNSASHAPSL
jgi:hypothetical protein